MHNIIAKYAFQTSTTLSEFSDRVRLGRVLKEVEYEARLQQPQTWRTRGLETPSVLVITGHGWACGCLALLLLQSVDPFAMYFSIYRTNIGVAIAWDLAHVEIQENRRTQVEGAQACRSRRRERNDMAMCHTNDWL